MENIEPITPLGAGLHLVSQTPENIWTDNSEGLLEVVVIFTDRWSTLEALKTAARFAGGLKVRVRLVVPQVVPYALPLNEPPIPAGFTEQQVGTLVSDLGVDTRVDICLCRNKGESLLHTLKRHSVVVIGSRRRWWPRWEKRLARELRRGGHEVILKETE